MSCRHIRFRNVRSVVVDCDCCGMVQELPEAYAAAQRYPDPTAQLCRLPQAQELAVVATLHQGQAAPTGNTPFFKYCFIFIFVCKY